MAHPNRLYNGDFARDLANWNAEGNAAFVANQGSAELGALSLPDAASAVEQGFTIGVGRPYMLEMAVRADAADGEVSVAITNSAGDAVWSAAYLTNTDWIIYTTRIGLAWGDYTLRLAFSDTACYVDDVSLAWVVKTRAELAASVANHLGVLASAAGFSTGQTQTATEGDYTDAVDEGLRAVGALDPAGRPDVRYLDTDTLSGCLGAIELAMLNKLHRYWVTKTDYAIGPRQEHLSQVQAALLALTGAAVGGRPASAGRGVQTRRLHHAKRI